MNSKPQLICAYKVYYPDFEINPFGYLHKLLFQGMMASDRFDLVTKYCGLNYVVQNDLQQLLEFDQSLTLRDIIQKRAQYIVELAQRHDKKIVILWSGGIDSTFVALALLQAKSTDQVIELVFNDTAIRDCNPDILDYFHKHNITMRYSNCNVIVNSVESQYRDNDYICVTGTGSDQVSIMGVLFQRSDLLNKPWTDAVEQYIVHNHWEQYFKTHKFSKQIIESELQKLPLSINNWAQFTIFWNNAIKTNKIMYDNVLNASTDYYRNHEIAFFNDHDFLNWGLYNLLPRFENTNIEHDVTEYKAHLKQYMIDFTGIQSIKYMTKTMSRWHEMTNDRFTVIDTQGFKDFGTCSTFDKYNVLKQLYNCEGD